MNLYITNSNAQRSQSMVLQIQTQTIQKTWPIPEINQSWKLQDRKQEKLSQRRCSLTLDSIILYSCMTHTRALEQC